MTDQTAGYDAGDRIPLSDSRGSERQKRRRLQNQRDDADLVWLMKQREGRRFISRLLQSCDLYVGLQVLADIVRLCPELHARMAGETAARGAGPHAQEDN